MITFYKSKNSSIKSRVWHGGSNRQRAKLNLSLARALKEYKDLPPSKPHLPLLRFSNPTPTATNEK